MENKDTKLAQVAQHKKKKHVAKKTVVIFFVASIIFLALVGVVIWYLSLRPEAANKNKIDEVVGTYSVIRQAEMAANSGKTDQSLEFYKQAISDSQDENIKLDLKTKMVIVLINSARYDEAMVLAREVEVVRPDSDICNLIFNIYILQGRQQEADDYYDSAKSIIIGQDLLSSSESEDDSGK